MRRILFSIVIIYSFPVWALVAPVIPECAQQGTVTTSDIGAHPLLFGQPISRELAAKLSNMALGNKCHAELIKHPESIRAYGYDPNYVQHLEEKEKIENMQQDIDNLHVALRKQQQENNHKIEEIQSQVDYPTMVSR